MRGRRRQRAPAPTLVVALVCLQSLLLREYNSQLGPPWRRALVGAFFQKCSCGRSRACPPASPANRSRAMGGNSRWRMPGPRAVSQEKVGRLPTAAAPTAAPGAPVLQAPPSPGRKRTSKASRGGAMRQPSLQRDAAHPSPPRPPPQPHLPPLRQLVVLAGAHVPPASSPPPPSHLPPLPLPPIGPFTCRFQQGEGLQGLGKRSVGAAGVRRGGGRGGAICTRPPLFPLARKVQVPPPCRSAWLGRTLRAWVSSASPAPAEPPILAASATSLVPPRPYPLPVLGHNPQVPPHRPLPTFSQNNGKSDTSEINYKEGTGGEGPRAATLPAPPLPPCLLLGAGSG